MHLSVPHLCEPWQETRGVGGRCLSLRVAVAYSRTWNVHNTQHDTDAIFSAKSALKISTMIPCLSETTATNIVRGVDNPADSIRPAASDEATTASDRL